MKKLDLLITGVGGQGVVLASDLYGEAAVAAGYDVKKTDTLGMAQRGGSVVSHVRIGPRVWSPLIEEGGVDLLLSFEKLEAARWSHYLRPGGVAIINDHRQPPPSVAFGQEAYPGDGEIAAALRRLTDKVYFIDGNRRARELGNARTVNVFMLGCLSQMAPIPVSAWKESLTRRLPEKIRAINLTAFQQGRKEMGHVCVSQD